MQFSQNSSIQSLSHARLFATLCDSSQHARPPCPSPTPGVLLKLMSIESVMPSNHLILCRPLLLLLSIFPSIRVFSNESALCIRWPMYWSFSFNNSPFNEHPGLISFRMDWLGLLASPAYSQESSPTPQFKSINPLVLSFLYSPALTSIHDYWKNHSFDYTDLFVGKLMSLLFNMLSRFVIALLPRSKCLLISLLQPLSTVILEPKKIKYVTASMFSPFYLPWSNAHIVIA